MLKLFTWRKSALFHINESSIYCYCCIFFLFLHIMALPSLGFLSLSWFDMCAYTAAALFMHNYDTNLIPSSLLTFVWSPFMFCIDMQDQRWVSQHDIISKKYELISEKCVKPNLIQSLLHTSIVIRACKKVKHTQPIRKLYTIYLQHTSGACKGFHRVVKRKINK